MSATSIPRPAIPPVDPVQLKYELRTASRELLDRQLGSAAKWCAQLLTALTSSSSPAAAGAQQPTQPRYTTSTPVKNAAAAGGSRTAPTAEAGASSSRRPYKAAGTSSTARHSLPGLPPMSSISHSHHAAGRDSLGSILEMGSSPVAPPPLHDLHHSQDQHADDDEEMDQEHGAERDAIREGGLRRDEEEQDMYLLALSYARTHEYLRAAHVLRACCGPRARWLRGYSKYLAGEKRMQEAAGELLGPKDAAAGAAGTGNPFARELLDEIHEWEEEGLVERDGYLLFLKALLLLSIPPLTPTLPAHTTPSSRPGDDRNELRLHAIDALVQSVTLEPYNWSAWLKIAECISGPEEMESLLPHLPQQRISYVFFFVHATLEIHAAGDSLHDILSDLEEIFPDALCIKGWKGLVHYHVREFDEATEYFTQLREADPYRVDDIDIFSNILYVSEKRAELATLATEYVEIDRSRPEVCCLIGNYYSLRREHEKAIIYFRRALKLDRGYLSAWTLMGHEYVEIKNTNAAIASYRRAVDVNHKDYRAWYGLGQTYELLGEPYYALNYYQKATALRPYDARMWSALAVCYEKLKRIPDAIKSYQRALVSSEPGESDTAIRIGRLYALQGNSLAAAQYHRRALYEGLKTDGSKAELSHIWLWLARWEMGREKDGSGQEGDLRLAEEYLNEVLGVQEDKEEAKALLKELNVLLLNRE